MRENAYWILICVFALLTIIENARSKKKHTKQTQKKPPVYDKTIYKPRKRENKGLPEGDFTHDHVESMWDEIK